VEYDVPLVIVREMPAPIPAPATPTDLETAEFEALDVETPNCSDVRPGLPLERPRAMQHNQLYHFEAFGTLWTVKLERTSSKQDARTKDGISNDAQHVFWASLEPLEGNQGMSDGTLEQFEKWFKKHGQLSPLEPPMRWRA
jgi:hypothetical protein